MLKCAVVGTTRAMGRSKGIVEVHLDKSEVAELAKCINDNIPAEHKGVCKCGFYKTVWNFLHQQCLAAINFCFAIVCNRCFHDMSHA